ncbi:nuclear transport factor 2 family protein [Flaviaesturariibacter amylovorans]|uniref:Nuclear transport factor 2 family protein n=1 Tax=Flaviaesturariibacter amylovorans TaxID=1084520 RepID=A0ABP8GFD1_9BACT
MRTLLTGLALLCAGAAAAQQPREEVERAVRDYVDAFYYGDTAKVHRSIAPDLVKHGYYRPRDSSTYTLDSMSFRQCISYAANVAKRGPSPKVATFPKKIEVYDVLERTASAKLTAWWGTDYILLSRRGDRWLITHVLWQSPPPANK